MKMTQREREELAVLIREEMVNGYTRELVTKALAQIQEDEQTHKGLTDSLSKLATVIEQKDYRIETLSRDLAYERGDYDDDDYDDYDDDFYDEDF